MVAVDINPATRAVVTGTEKFTREVCRRLPAAAPELRWRFLASRPKTGLGVDVLVVPQRRLWSQLRLPLALFPERPDLLFVPAHAAFRQRSFAVQARPSLQPASFAR